MSSLRHLDNVDLGRVDGIRGTEAQCRLAPLRDRVTDDDPCGPRDAGSLNDRNADATEAHDKDGGAFLDPGGVEDRAHAGLHRAADDGCDIQRSVWTDLHGAVLAGDDQLPETSDAKTTSDDGAATRQRRRAIGECATESEHRLLAERCFSTYAPVAASAGRERRQEHLVAGRQ